MGDPRSSWPISLPAVWLAGRLAGRARRRRRWMMNDDALWWPLAARRSPASRVRWIGQIARGPPANWAGGVRRPAACLYLLISHSANQSAGATRGERSKSNPSSESKWKAPNCSDGREAQSSKLLARSLKRPAGGAGGNQCKINRTPSSIRPLHLPGLWVVGLRLEFERLGLPSARSSRGAGSANGRRAESLLSRKPRAKSRAGERATICIEFERRK